MSALAVFSDVIGVRLLLASVLVGVVGTVGVVLGLPSLLAAAPNVVTSLQFGATALLLLLATFGSMLAFTFMVLSSRQSSQFIPLRDYEYFVQRITTLS